MSGLSLEDIVAWRNTAPLGIGTGRMAKPFRWNFAKREQLGTWLDRADRFHPPHRDDLSALRNAAARILAFSNGADLAFVGRSPENFYDYLSGCFEGISDTPDLSLIPFSMRWVGEGGVDAIAAHKFSGLAEALAANGLSPQALAASQRPVALVDFIAYGGTMEALVSVLNRMARETATDWNAVQRRLRIIGLTHRTKNSPNTWRWQQNQDWLGLIPDARIKNVSAPSGFLFLIANADDKVTYSFHAGRWDSDVTGAPEPSADQLRGMAKAAWLYDLGNTREERETLARLIAAHPEMRQPATRALVSALKRG
ncbi:hypothetical protein GCM10011503_01210 [Henriciella pelagia]|jgi:hypothetical protein|uniref:Uncharacterized protein n=2 Tax=Hyphomonadaceae TaxID=69657 RepID=A0ABQ1IZS3_9PROT|nr:hypothetical protein GCM10011503_01210 [Henriciella pelagia]